MKKLMIVLLLVFTANIISAQQVYKTSITKYYELNDAQERKLLSIEETPTYFSISENKIMVISSTGELRNIYFDERVVSFKKTKSITAIDAVDGVNHTVIVTVDFKKKSVSFEYMVGIVTVYSGLESEFERLE